MREAAPSQGCPRCPRWLAAATVLQGIAATVLLLLVVIQPTTVVVQSLQPTARPQGFAALISPSGPAVTEPQAQMRGPPAAAAQSEAAAAKRYAYGVEAPLALPSPPPPEPAMPAASASAREVQSEPWFHEQVNALHARIEQVEAAAKRPTGASR